MKPVPTNEDRIWAVISHLSAIAFGMGILLPIIGWSEQTTEVELCLIPKFAGIGISVVGLYRLGFVIFRGDHLSSSLSCSSLCHWMRGQCENSMRSCGLDDRYFHCCIWVVRHFTFYCQLLQQLPARLDRTFATRSWEIDWRAIWDMTVTKAEERTNG